MHNLLPSENLANFAEKSRPKPVVVKFSADWCAPCKKHPFHNVEASLPEAVFVVCDVDKCPEMATRYDVRSIPTVLTLDKNGFVVGTPIVGVPKAEVLTKEIRERIQMAKNR